MPKSNFRKKKPPKRVLALPDLEHAKTAVLNSLTSASGQRTYDHAIREFVAWYCSEPRLAFNRTVVLRYRIHLEQRGYAPAPINFRLTAVRRVAYEAADAGLLSPELAAGIRRVKGVPRIGVRLGNWLTPEQGRHTTYGAPAPASATARAANWIRSSSCLATCPSRPPSATSDASRSSGSPSTTDWASNPIPLDPDHRQGGCFNPLWATRKVGISEQTFYRWKKAYGSMLPSEARELYHRPLAYVLHGYWQRRFAGDRDIVGQAVQIDGKLCEVVGVLPPSFRFLDRNPAVLLPLRLNSAGANLGGFNYNAIARLKPGVTIVQANDDVARMIPLVWERFPPRAGEQKIQLGPNLRPLHDDAIGNVGRLLWILLGTVGIVLLIACANVANLFLVRAEGRRRELAVRTALGASRSRLAQGLLAECVMLGLVGGVLGLGLARAGIGLLVWLAPSGLPRVEEIGLQPVVLLFTATIAIVAGLLFGLLVVLKLGAPTVTALQEGGRSASEGPERHRARNTLVVAQVALALVLLVVSALMVRTFIALRQVEPGFTRPEQVQTLRIAIPGTLMSDPQQVVQAHEQIADRLRQIPGVQSVGLGSSITMDGIFFNGSILVEEFPESGGRNRRFRRHKFIAPGYFETMGNPVLMGRSITWRDIYQDALVAVVSAQLAREYWADPAEALGKRLRVSPSQPWREIIGIVGNELDDGLNQAPPAIVYWPMAAKRFLDQPFVSRTMSYAVRSERIHSPGFRRELEEAVWSVNPNLPLANVRTLADIRAKSMAQTSFALTMLVIAAVMALLLGVVGLYGVVAYISAQRTREIGIRMALGAQRGDVSRLFVRHGLWLTALGVALGIGAALGFTRLMSSLVFGVSTTDLVTYVTVSASLGGVALLATYLPARRAARVDPISALRWDT